MPLFARISLCLAALSVPTQSMALTPTLKTTIDNPVRPTVRGQTNLPDGTKLLLTISRPESRFDAQTQVKVANGTFRSEQFSQKGADLNPGKYTLEIIMPMSQVQPGEVRAVIGIEGERLAGPLVQRAIVGKVVRYVTTFSIGRASSAQADLAARTREKSDRERWVEQSCQDIAQRAAPAATSAERSAAMAKCIIDVKGKKPN